MTTTAHTTSVLPATLATIPSSFPYTVSGYKVDNRVGCWGQAVVGLYIDGKLAVTARNSPTGGPAVLDPRNAEERARIQCIISDLKESGSKPEFGGEWDEEQLADLCLIEGEAVAGYNRRSNVLFVKSTADLKANRIMIISKSSAFTPERIAKSLAKYPTAMYWSKPDQAWVPVHP